jgi:hypothetical protein
MTPEERVRVLAEAKPNSWVAFSSDESKVVAQADSYEQAGAEAEKQGEEDPVLVLIPDRWSPRAL